MRPALAAAVAAAGAVAVVVAQYPYPTVWPAQHTHQEIMYVPGLDSGSYKPVYYDFTNSKYRADLQVLPQYAWNPLAPTNQSSYWLNDDLFIYQSIGAAPTCVHLNLGFGMMIPSWFLGGTQNGTWWHVKKYQWSSGDNGMYVNTLSTQSIVDGQGTFDYHSIVNASISSSDPVGAPHHFTAPSPLGLVVNEYNNFTVANFSVNDPIFALPEGVACVNTSMPTATIGDVFAAAAHHAPHLMPEIVMAARSRKLI